MTKRPNGEGSISRIRKGRYAGWYCARVTVGVNAQGDPIRKTKYAQTYDEAQRALSDLRSQHDVGSTVGDDPTIGEWLDEWLRRRERDPDLANASWSANEIQVRVHLKPLIGAKRLRSFRKDDAEHLVAVLRKRQSRNGRPLSTTTIRQIVNTADLAFEAAVPDRIPANPFHRVKRPRKAKPDHKALTEEQIAKLYAYLDESVAHRNVAPIVVTLLECGLREGELLGLTWDDLVLHGTRPTISVRRAMKRHRARTDTIGKFRTTQRVGTVKTPKAIRTFKISQRAVDALTQQRDHQDAARRRFTERVGSGARATWGNGTDDFVFTTSIGTPLELRNVQRAVVDVAAAVGLGSWSPHDLRHTFGSRLFNADVPLEKISAIMGHSDTRTTYSTYVHPKDDYADDCADALDRLAG